MSTWFSVMFLLLFLFVPLDYSHAALSSTSLVSEQAQSPDQCEMGVSAEQKNCSRGFDNRQFFYQTDISCATKRIGVPTYTAELTSFNDTACTWGPCNNGIEGIAHRTWPPGSKVEVCNLKNGFCAVAVVMDRGPNVCLTRRTIDANPALQAALRMQGGTVPATYRLLSAPNIMQTAQPKGPTQPNVEAVIAASNVRNQYGGQYGTGPSMTYSTIDTPYGPGYLGTPTGGYTSPFANIGAMLTGYAQQTPYAQNNSPYTSPFANVSPVQIGNDTSGQSGSNSSSGGPTPYIPTAASDTRYFASSILVQPPVVAKGDAVVVSWTSVGMSAPCQIFMGASQIIGQGFEGARSVVIPGTSSSTSATFKARCQTYSGAVDEHTASVTLR